MVRQSGPGRIERMSSVRFFPRRTCSHQPSSLWRQITMTLFLTGFFFLGPPPPPRGGSNCSIQAGPALKAPIGITVAGQSRPNSSSSTSARQTGHFRFHR